MSGTSLNKRHNSCCTGCKDSSEVVFYLPVAPLAVARTRFSPPTPVQNQNVMIPEALELLGSALEDETADYSMVAITGPGDPLAVPDITLETIRLVKERYPGMKIGLQTVGIGSDKLAADLATTGVDYIEILVNGVSAEVLEKLYAWVRPGQKTLTLSQGVELLIKEQRHGVPALKFHDISVSISTTLYPGFNMNHVGKISSEMMELGADSISLQAYSPAPGSEVVLESPTTQEIAKVTKQAAKHLPVVKPVLQYRPYNPDMSTDSIQPPPSKPSKERPNVAVVSSNGIEVNQHLGQAGKFLIYGPREDGLACLLEARNAPQPGLGVNRWQEVAAILSDCFILLTASAGETPRRVLAEAGLKLHIAEDNIEGFVDVLYGGGKKGKKMRQDSA